MVLTVLTALQKGSVTDERLFDMSLSVVKMLLQKQIPKEKVRSLMSFLRFYLHFDNPEMKAKFDTEIELITTGNHTTMGIEQFLLQRAENKGIKKGIEKGIEIASYEKDLSFTTKLLIDTDFTSEKIAGLAGVTVAFVEEVKASLQ